MTELAEKNFD